MTPEYEILRDESGEPRALAIYPDASRHDSGPSVAPETVATPGVGIHRPTCGARLVAWEMAEDWVQASPGRCGYLVGVRRKSGCCDAHKVRIWSDARPRQAPLPLGPPAHSRRRSQRPESIRSQILGILADKQWHTVWELAEACRCMETAASAKLRDLRKKKHGAFVIESRRLPESAAHEYRLVIGAGADESKEG